MLFLWTTTKKKKKRKTSNIAPCAILLHQCWIGLLDLVEAWAGVPVEQTVMYGLRQYETGARLLTHVDRITTHAVSLIVNVAQGNLTEPWPVEVQDHMDRLHEGKSNNFYHLLAALHL